MNSKSRIWGALFIPLAVACTTGGTGRDSETHFVCRADDECRTKFGSGYGCVEQTCEKTVRGSGFACDAGPCVTAVADAATDATKEAQGVLNPTPRPPDAGNCTRVTLVGELLRQNLFVVLDQSISMADPVPSSSGTWWEGAVAGIQDFSTSLIAAPAHIAIQYFPLGSSPAESCTAAYDQPDVDFADTPTNPDVLAASLSAHSPGGLPAQGPALSAAIDHTRAITQPTQLAKVVLITKSAPSQCEPMTPSGLATVAASGLAGSPSVATYVMGLDMSPLVYGPVVTAGGTNNVLSVTEGDVRRQVRDAFDVVMGFEATSGPQCEIDISGLDGGHPTDPSLVDIFYELDRGMISEVTLVRSASECAGLDRDGWYFDDPTAPKKAILCPEQCAHPRSYIRGAGYRCRQPPPNP